MEKVSMNSSIGCLGLSAITYTCLKRAGIDKVGDIIDLPEEDWSKIRNLGPHRMSELKEKIDGLKVDRRKLIKIVRHGDDEAVIYFDFRTYFLSDKAADSVAYQILKQSDGKITLDTSVMGYGVLTLRENLAMASGDIDIGGFGLTEAIGAVVDTLENSQ